MLKINVCYAADALLKISFRGCLVLAHSSARSASTKSCYLCQLKKNAAVTQNTLAAKMPFKEIQFTKMEAVNNCLHKQGQENTNIDDIRNQHISIVKKNSGY